MKMNAESLSMKMAHVHLQPAFFSNTISLSHHIFLTAILFFEPQTQRLPCVFIHSH